MALFFFVVGLEIKRELVTGDLRSFRAAALPAIGAAGGMVVPALLYFAFNTAVKPRGWGIPMATDIAFAVGIVALLGSRVSPKIKLFPADFGNRGRHRCNRGYSNFLHKRSQYDLASDRAGGFDCCLGSAEDTSVGHTRLCSTGHIHLVRDP